MFPVEAFRSTVVKFAGILRKHAIPFHLTGGVTSTAWGEPRMTQDIDIVIGNTAVTECLDQFLDSVGQANFLKNDESIRNAVLSKQMFQLLDNDESLKLDVYPRELVEGELSRSEEVEVFEGEFLPLVSRADAAISKLIWIQKGSHKSRRDLRKIWENCDTNTRRNIESVAKANEILGLLKLVVNESDEFEC